MIGCGVCRWVLGAETLVGVDDDGDDAGGISAVPSSTKAKPI